MPRWRNWHPPRLASLVDARRGRARQNLDNMIYYLYILISTQYPITYTGISKDPIKRLKSHNQGQNKFTRKFRPWKLIHLEKHPNLKVARKREKYFKTAAGRKLIAKIIRAYKNAAVAELADAHA